MKRASALLVAHLSAVTVVASVQACGDASGSSEGAPTDAAVDGGRDRQVPTSQEDDAESACTPGDASAATPPDEYRDRKNPLSSTADVIAAGRTAFANRCALCHGDEGRGDGREGPFDPPPADFTARRRDDAYLFWRLSEGGTALPFCSAMPAFRDLYTERQRWELVVFIQDTFAPMVDGGADAADAD